jgi:hypothetical protein
MLIEQCDAKMYEEKQKNKARYVSLLTRDRGIRRGTFFNPNDRKTHPLRRKKQGRTDEVLIRIKTA